MRKPIIMALMAVAALPMAAQAQSNGELRHDRRDIRHEQRDLRDARRSGDPAQIRDERHDLRDARQEYRDDVRDRNHQWARDDWRAGRDRNPGFYGRGNWNAPFRYTGFRAGLRIAPLYYGPRYVIADPWRYRLPAAGFGRTWVRHYNDVLLIDTRRGIVIDVIHGFYR